ncbi:MAG: hypothetical protein ACRENS_10060 [Candidatus Eiseniibacteriota bacterium]
MPRFKANRWWAFVLALGLVLGSAVAAHAQTHGGVSSAFVTGGDNSGDGGGSIGTPPVGDPDNPTGIKGSYRIGHSGPVQVPGRSVGDGSGLGRVWMMRLGALLQLTRLRLFGI